MQQEADFACAIDYSYGFSSPEVQFIDNSIICYVVGNSITFISVEDGSQSVLHGEGLGIGPFACNQRHRLVAYAEKGNKPNIYVYAHLENGENNWYATLSGGTELAYLDLAFSRDGTRIISLGDLPDYNLAVWTWEDESCLFQPISVDVGPSPRVSFNPRDHDQFALTSEGQLTVWNIEHTHTQYTPVPIHGSMDSIGGGDLPAITSHCWSAEHDYLYCGTDAAEVVTFETQTGYFISQIPIEADEPGIIHSMLLTRSDLVMCGQDGTIRWYSLPDLELSKSISLGPLDIRSATFSTDYRTLVLATAQRTLHMVLLPDSDEEPINVCQLCDYHQGPITGLDCFDEQSFLLVTCGHDGTFRVWDYIAKQLLSKLEFDGHLCALSCSAATNVVACGSQNGVLRLFDITDPLDPNMIHRIKLHDGPITHVKFDPMGNYLVSTGDDKHVFFLDAHPTAAFKVIGYVEVSSHVTDIKWHIDQEYEYYQLYVACDNGDVFRFEPPGVQTASADNSYLLANADVQKSLLKMQYPGYAIDLKPAEKFSKGTHFFAVDKTKQLVYYSMPDETQDPELMDDSDVVGPEEVFEAHHKLPTACVVSPSKAVIATAGRDGVITLRSTSDLHSSMKWQRHDPFMGGVNHVAFSQDGNYLFSAGQDGLLLCWTLDDGSKFRPQPLVKRDTQFTSMPEITEPDIEPEQEPHFLQLHTQTQLQEEEALYANKKNEIKSKVAGLSQELADMLDENARLPEIDQLDPSEFIIDYEERDRLYELGMERVQEFRSTIELENMARELLSFRLKSEFWDSMDVPQASILAFRSDERVSNYVLPKQDPAHLATIEKIKTMRRVEIQEFNSREAHNKPSLLALTSTASVPGDPSDDADGPYGSEAGPSASRSAATSSRRRTGVGMTPSVSGASRSDEEDLEEMILDEEEHQEEEGDLLYDDYELYTSTRKKIQIQLLHMLIRDRKAKFNVLFEETMDSKRGDLAKIAERNHRIRKIMDDLGWNEPIKQFELQPEEIPDSVLTVQPWEVNAQGDKSRAQMEEERRKREAENAKEEKDDAGDRGLRMMMGGRLDAQGDDTALEDELVRPDWMNKPVEEMSDEEKQLVKEFKEKEAAILLEREKRRKAHETELRKLQASIEDVCGQFDARLHQLFLLKIDTDQSIYELEFKIIKLSQALLAEENFQVRTKELVTKITELRDRRNSLLARKNEFQREVERYEKNFAELKANDANLNSSFKRDFADQGEMVDVLYRLYRRKPKSNKHQANLEEIQQAANGADDPFAYVDAEEHLARLDIPDPTAIDRPDGIEDSVWERLMQARIARLDSEQELRLHEQELDQMHAYLDRLENEDQELQREMEAVLRQTADFETEKMRERLNLDVLLKLKQGQVEVGQNVVTTDYTDSVYIPVGLVRNLNDKIIDLGTLRVKAMQQNMKIRKQIHDVEWENQFLDLKAEELMAKISDIQLLRVTKQLQSLIKGGDEASQDAEVKNLEKRSEHAARSHDHKVKDKKRALKRMMRLIEEKNMENQRLDEQLAQLDVDVNERQQLVEIQEMHGKGSTSKTSETRMKEISQMRSLKEIAKAQKEEIAFLKSELSRLRQKTFPSFQVARKRNDFVG